MSHIFGIAHSFGGIVEQIGNVFSPSNSPAAQFGLYGPRAPVNAFVPNPNVDSTFGSGAGTNVPIGGGAGCGNVCGSGTKRYTTTVCSDGTVTTRLQKSRKRKRRLATVSDIKDLASLKTVLGGGKAFESWIATRGR